VKEFEQIDTAYSTQSNFRSPSSCSSCTGNHCTPWPWPLEKPTIHRKRDHNCIFQDTADIPGPSSCWKRESWPASQASPSPMQWWRRLFCRQHKFTL